MTITRNHEGYVLSDIVQGYFFHKLYIGHTKREAMQLFRKEIKQKGKVK